MSEIQAVIFEKKYFTPDKARYWLKKHKIKRMKKVRITKNYYRYRITNPKKYKNFIIKPIYKDNVKLVIGYL